jgi:hypothetical protein
MERMGVKEVYFGGRKDTGFFGSHLIGGRNSVSFATRRGTFEHQHP